MEEMYIGPEPKNNQFAFTLNFSAMVSIHPVGICSLLFAAVIEDGFISKTLASSIGFVEFVASRQRANFASKDFVVDMKYSEKKYEMRPSVFCFLVQYFI